MEKEREKRKENDETEPTTINQVHVRVEIVFFER